MTSLQVFADARARFVADADGLKAGFFFFSPANVLPKLALGKLTIEQVDNGHALVSPDGTARVIPTGTPKEYYGRLLAALGRYKTVSLVPQFISQHLAKSYACATQHKEYVLSTAVIREHPGGDLSRLRKYVNAANRKAEITPYDERQKDEFLALNKLWYRQAAPTKFRTYDKTSIDWLIENWALCRELTSDLVMLGVRDRESGRLLSFNVGSLLTHSVWTAYTERYDREAPFRQPNTAGFVALAHLFPQVMENDGTADTKEIREIKERYRGDLLVACKVSRK